MESLTREALEAKLKTLQASERQAFAAFNAVMGARQFCEQLINELATSGVASEDDRGEEQSDGSFA